MLRLHDYVLSAECYTVRLMLALLGVPYERELVERSRNQHKAPDYLALNPNGLIPVLADGDLVLYETAAIVLHLCDTHPAARLAPAVGTHERDQVFQQPQQPVRRLEQHDAPLLRGDAGEQAGTIRTFAR